MIWGQVITELTTVSLQEVQNLEQKSNEALMTLEANINILSSLRDFYTNLIESNTDLLPGKEFHKTVDAFSKKLKNMESDIQRFQKRAERLVRMTADNRNLVGQVLYAPCHKDATS